MRGFLGDTLVVRYGGSLGVVGGAAGGGGWDLAVIRRDFDFMVMKP